MNKDELIKIIKEYGEQNDNRIDLSGADFGGLEVDFSAIKADFICNSKQKAEVITNHNQEARTIDNDYQKAHENLRNRYQKAIEISNSSQDANYIYNYYQDAEEITNHGQEATTIDNCGQRIYDKIYFNIGEYNRTIYVNHVKDFKFDIGCFEGTAEELRKSSIEKYGTENNPYLEIIEDYETNVKEKK